MVPSLVPGEREQRHEFALESLDLVGGHDDNRIAVDGFMTEMPASDQRDPIGDAEGRRAFFGSGGRQG
jgi:hypothetical protein